MKGEHVFFVPFDCLPEDDTARAERLEVAFHDHCVASSRTEGGWAVSLRWPDDPSFYVDPRLEEGLAWWKPGTRVIDVPLAVRQEPGFQLSLSDAWSLLSWSRWLRDRAGQGAAVKRAVLLHVDSHSDLISPRLWKTDDGVVDAITGARVDVLAPDSVTAAICSGAIDIATYIPPLVHEIPELHVRYLRPTVPPVDYLGPYWLEAALVPEDLLAPASERSRIEARFTKIDPACHAPPPPGATTLRVSDTFDDWLGELPDGPILLHLDCDYFNNRHDQAAHDPGPDEVLARIDELFDALAARRLFDRIADVTVALSPKFFPAELWGVAVERVRSHVRRLRV